MALDRGRRLDSLQKICPSPKETDRKTLYDERNHCRDCKSHRVSPNNVECDPKSALMGREDPTVEEKDRQFDTA